MERIDLEWVELPTRMSSDDLIALDEALEDSSFMILSKAQLVTLRILPE